MYKIILDCDLMRYRIPVFTIMPVFNLGTMYSVSSEKENEGRMAFYVPAAEKNHWPARNLHHRAEAA